MPILYRHYGIVIRFYSDEHDPVHVHAMYQDAVVKVVLHTEKSVVVRIEYIPTQGEFPKAEMKRLKRFIDVFKQKIVMRWVEYFVMKERIKAITINRKLTHEDSFN